MEINQVTIEFEMKRKATTSSPFGQRLRQIRQARGLTQKKFGECVGLSERMVGHYEKYVKFPPIDLIPILAKALKVTTDELLGVKPFKDEALSKNKNLMRRFRIVGAFPLRDQRAVFSLINALAQKQGVRKTSK